MEPHRPARHRSLLWPALRARPHLVGSALFGGAIFLLVLAFVPLPGASATLIGWNSGVLLYLAVTWRQVSGADAGAIEGRARVLDQGRLAILAVVVLAAGAVLLAVGTQLSQVKSLHGTTRITHVLLAVLTIVTSWLFTQAVFAMHYAHDFYTARLRGAPDPLAFPGTPDPLYADFLHFACVIGTSAQTADISFNGSALRPVGTTHCIVSFFFNATVLALSINVAASVIL